ncbi:LuxS/MPP-like metallohydrolase [Meredithblackwellia eburnea MCA 4105]
MRRTISRAPRLARSLVSAKPISHNPPPLLSLPLKYTTLPNGVRVASDPTPGHFVAAGVYVDAGSRFEGDRTRGASHMTDRLGFKSTANRTAEQMTKEIEKLGGQFTSTSSRESMMYQATTYTRDLPQAISILSDTVLHAQLTAEELDAQRDSAAWEVSELNSKPDMILPERLHEVAYRDNTLGNPLLCPEAKLETMTPSTLHEFRDLWYKPDRLVLAGAGMEHEQLVELAHKHFGDLKSSSLSLSSTASLLSSSRQSSNLSSKPSISKFLSTSASNGANIVPTPSSTDFSSSAIDPNSFEYLATANARYTGGELYIPDPTLEFTHFHFAWEGLPITDPDIYTLATLQMLLGGGGSFSAGGPGKGMYSHLYTKVLNQYHAVDHCVSFHHCYVDSGLFGIQISVKDAFVNQTPGLIATIISSLTHVTRGGINPTELERAKNQLKSNLAMQLESRIIQAEDLGRQTQVLGHKVTTEETAKRVDAVTMQDIYRVASRVLRPWTSPIISDRSKTGKPTVIVQGQLDRLPDVMGTLKRWDLVGPS